MLNAISQSVGASPSKGTRADPFAAAVPFLSPAYDSFASLVRNRTPDSDLELQPLHPDTDTDPAPSPPAQARQETDPQRQGLPPSLLDRLEHGEPMKFSHSLLFNSVPEWTSYYLKCAPRPAFRTTTELMPVRRSYENLKSTIYKFERSSLLPTPPAEPYSDEPTPSALEGSLPAVSSEVTTPATQAKIFTRLLDQEVHKMTEFYTTKEAELLDDLQTLVDDIARVEQEQDDEADAVSLAHSRGGVSGASDTDEEDDRDDDEGDDGVAARTSKLLRGALTSVFSNPRNYDAATRAGRKHGRRGTSAGASSSGKSPARVRAYSQVSMESDLLDLRENDEAGETQFTLQPSRYPANGGPSVVAEPTSPVKRSLPALGRKQSRSTTAGSPAWGRRSSMRRPSQAPMQDDEDDGEGLWGDRSDWAIDTKIMFKRRLAAVFMVSRR